MKISKQFGLFPLNVVWEMFECPNMLIRSNPAPEDSLITTSEMITLYVCRKQRVVLDMYFLKYEEPAKFSSAVDFDGKYAPQKEKCSLATLRVVILMNANPVVLYIESHSLIHCLKNQIQSVKHSSRL